MSDPTASMESFPRRARDILLAAHDAMPTAEQVDCLLMECGEGLERGYFTPDEEAKIRSVFVDFLQVRAALGEVILEAWRRLPLLRRRLNSDELRIFIPGWLAGCMVLRGSRYLVDHFKSQRILRRLLNRPDPVNGVPAGMFERVYHTSTSIAYLSRFFWGLRVAETNAGAIWNWRPIPTRRRCCRCSKAKNLFCSGRNGRMPARTRPAVWARRETPPATTCDGSAGGCSNPRGA